MGENSKIEWTDHTWNPWRGCEHARLADGSIHPGCLHCYAERGAKRNPKVMGVWGAADAGGTRVMAAEKTFNVPLEWDKLALAHDRTAMVFVDSYSDFFEDYAGDVLNHRGERLLVCDNCGRFHVDSVATELESCECSRFRPPMEWAKLDDVRGRRCHAA